MDLEVEGQLGFRYETWSWDFQRDTVAIPYLGMGWLCAEGLGGTNPRLSPKAVPGSPEKQDFTYLIKSALSTGFYGYWWV